MGFRRKCVITAAERGGWLNFFFYTWGKTVASAEALRERYFSIPAFSAQQYHDGAMRGSGTKGEEERGRDRVDAG